METSQAHHAEEGMNLDSDAAWQEVGPSVEELWFEIFKTADKIFKVHLKFGFEQFTDKLSPSIEEILLSLKAVESLLDGIHHALDYSEQRSVMNAKQQILWVQDVAEALQHRDEIRYANAMKKIGKQAFV